MMGPDLMAGGQVGPQAENRVPSPQIFHFNHCPIAPFLFPSLSLLTQPIWTRAAAVVKCCGQYDTITKEMLL